MKSRFPRLCALFFLIFLSAPSSLAAAPTETGEDLTISVLTFGPSDHPFFKFGHNAILVHRGTGEGWVYNFGTFTFDSIDLLPTFLRGRVIYWLSVASEEAALQSYMAENRSIVRQELDLAPADRLKLWHALEENARPENRGYLYDYFRDNCSTRVRDAIDRITSGRVRLAGRAPAQGTFRSHALRMTADFFPEYLGLYLALGSQADIPISRWEEAYIPENFQALLREVRIPAPQGERPLVKSEVVLFAAQRPPHFSEAPPWGIRFLLAGGAFGLALALLGRQSRTSRGCRVMFGSLATLIGFAVGMAGTLLTLLWAFTNHQATHHNANILVANPLAVAWVILGLGIALGGVTPRRRACFVAKVILLSTTLALLLKIFGITHQDNGPLLAFFLPLWIGLWVGLREERSTATQKSPRRTIVKKKQKNA